MRHPLITIPALLLVGLCAGVTFTFFELRDTASPDPISQAQPVTGQDGTSIEVAALRAEIASLESRIAVLEEAGVARALPPASAREGDAITPLTTTEGEPGTGNPASAVIASVSDNLVAAGVDRGVADAIVDRQNQRELRLLELRDKATREGYLRTPRYRDEVSEVMADAQSLRDEVGDETYDRFLWASGQTNRIGVESVIAGSAAAEAGIEPGDLITRYDEARVFNWRDLNSATTAGERDEYVDVTIIRSGSEFRVSIPRGPLGVRLSPASRDPDDQG